MALLANEPAANEVERLLREEQPAVTVVNLAEALDVTQRIHRLAEGELRSVLEPLLGEAILVVAQAEEDAWAAAAVRAEHYDRARCAISIADCFLLAGAAASHRIATADPAVAATALERAIEVVALPDSSGQRP